MNPDAPEPTPEMRRRADRLGLALGAVALAILVASVIVFTLAGLPKDAKEVKRLEQREAVRAAESAASSAQPTPGTAR